jgi:hypothetical protein
VVGVTAMTVDVDPAGAILLGIAADGLFVNVELSADQADRIFALLEKAFGK